MSMQINNQTQSDKKYIYVFVRQDLSLAQQLVQASHAAHEAGLHHNPSKTTSSVIIFGTSNKEELENLFAKYKQNLQCYPFFEPYKDVGLTSFATEPIPEEKRNLFKQFKLWKPKEINPII